MKIVMKEIIAHPVQFPRKIQKAEKDLSKKKDCDMTKNQNTQSRHFFMQNKKEFLVN